MPKAFKYELRDHFEYWRPVLGMEGWDITLRFDEQKLLGYCHAQPKYLKAVLGFNLDRIRKEVTTLEGREELVLHEMVHAVAWKASETAVSQITLSLLRARAAGNRPAWRGS